MAQKFFPGRVDIFDSSFRIQLINNVRRILAEIAETLFVFKSLFVSLRVIQTKRDLLCNGDQQGDIALGGFGA